MRYLTRVRDLLQSIFQCKAYLYAVAGVLAICIVSLMFYKHFFVAEVSKENVQLVRTVTVGVGAGPQNYNYSGEVRGRYESQLAFQVNGKIIKRFVDLGAVVKPGDVLMQIDAKDIVQTVNITGAQVNSAESQLRLAESNLKRFRKLYEDGVVSRMVYDQYVSAYDVATAGVQQASAMNVQGSNLLDYSTLRADKPGVVASITAEAGQVVGAGQPILTIVQDGEREVEISVPENRIEELRKSQQIKVTFWALSGVSIDGKVREIAPMADPLTRTYKVRISLINPVPEIKLGMTSSVTVLDADSSKAVQIPISAIYQTQEKPCVWLVKNGTVQLQPVSLGQYGNNTVLVTSGLNTGDIVVTAGVHLLRQGDKVRTGGDSK
jgi:multidrug efflux system membrane fusion protein